MLARFSHSSFQITLAIFTLGAMAVLYISTPAGAGLANDSAAYIGGARSILQGTGYSDIWLDSNLEAITHYPPLLSLCLSILGLAGFDPQRGARILNILLYGGNTILVGLLAWKISRSKIAGLYAAAVFVLNATLLRIHIFALSEPLFLFLSLIAFLCFDYALSPGSKKGFLFLTGIAAGLAFLTRYSALALLPTFGLALFLFQRTWRERFGRLAIFLAGAVPPMAAWFIRNKLVAGNVTNRTFQFHAITMENIRPGLYNTSQVLIPYEPWRQEAIKSGFLVWLLTILAIALLIWVINRSWNYLFQNEQQEIPPAAFPTAVYVFGYTGAVLFSMSFFDASTKFQPRILAPIFVCFILLSAAFGTWLWHTPALFERKHFSIKANQLIVLILALGTFGFSIPGFSRAVTEFQSAGLGYASWKWHDSLIMAALRELPMETIIYTNTPPAVYLVTERASRPLPTPIDPVDNHARSDYEQNLDQMNIDLLSGKAVLALFDTSMLDDTSGMQNTDNLIAQLKILQKAQGDVLYGKP